MDISRRSFLLAALAGEKNQIIAPAWIGQENDHTKNRLGRKRPQTLKQLIVNADDLGYTLGVNRAILHAVAIIKQSSGSEWR